MTTIAKKRREGRLRRHRRVRKKVHGTAARPPSLCTAATVT